MSYFDYPRLHFSGKFIADPSTINNYPANNLANGDLSKMQLYWNPDGTGDFAFEDCVVTKVEYADGSIATTKAEDSIVGESVSSIKNFMLSGAIVDLDPRQMMVSTLFGLNFQIGGDENLKGEFSSTPFNGIWNFPPTTASATYQGSMKNLSFSASSSSKYLKEIQSNAKLSINLTVTQYNMSPQLYSFNDNTFASMLSAGVPQLILDKIEDFKTFSQYQGQNHDKFGDIPTQRYVSKLLVKYLGRSDYNKYQEIIFSETKANYEPGSPFEFTKGLIVGTVGPELAAEPEFVVSSRVLVPSDSSVTSFTYFNVTGTDTGSKVQLNFANSFQIDRKSQPLGFNDVSDLYLARVSEGQVSQILHESPLPLSGSFLVTSAGFLQIDVDSDVSSSPISLVKKSDDGSYTVIQEENIDGYFLRADQFVYRMNPNSTGEYGKNAELKVYVYQYGQPVEDGVEIDISLNKLDMNGGTAISFEDAALKFESTKVKTVSGVATFKMSCIEPTGPFPNDLDGDVYNINYKFTNSSLAGYKFASGDSVSVHVYQSEVSLTGKEVLQQYGEIYPVMSWLTDEALVKERKGVVLSLLQQPLTSISHMPVTRDMSIAKRKLAIEWVESL
ncbi:MAG: hypothetical protein NE334_17665 [Lentisphaeraceae bacterium]|nr:hypothetical protein [Lentisphaeraceae bacterium]